MRRFGGTEGVSRATARSAATPTIAEVATGPSTFLAGSGALRGSMADVGVAREKSRRRRLSGLFLLLLVPAAYLWGRIVAGDGLDLTNLSLPSIDPMLLLPGLFFLALLGVLLGSTMGAGRSPHVTYRPEQIDVTMDSVIGIDTVKDDVIRSLNLFLAHKTFAAEMGGTARRGLLFEGAPGTGKTYLAKAMAREAGVPFLFVSATSFQSMYYGATARKIRSYFKALRKAARQEGGAIGFIEEIDAIAMARGGVSMTAMPTSMVAALCCGGLDDRFGRVGQHAVVDFPSAAGRAQRLQQLLDQTCGDDAAVSDDEQARAELRGCKACECAKAACTASQTGRGGEGERHAGQSDCVELDEGSIALRALLKAGDSGMGRRVARST